MINRSEQLSAITEPGSPDALPVDPADALAQSLHGKMDGVVNFDALDNRI